MSSAPKQTGLDQFQWEVQPVAERVVRDILDDAVARSPYLADLKRRMRDETGTRLFDWLDHLVVPDAGGLRESLRNAGFIGRFAAGAGECFVHEEGMFPAIIPTHDRTLAVAFNVESVADFLAVAQLTDVEVEGEPLAPMRRARVASQHDVETWAVERHGHRGYGAPGVAAEQALLVLKHAETFRLRRRSFADEAEGFVHANSLIDAAILDLGVNRACDLFFAAEREYWQRRNRAAQVQKARQDRLGLGWANHDHHTYRSSREHFARLIAVFEKLGFRCRERFYAGNDAGWGAQVLEQPVGGSGDLRRCGHVARGGLGDFAHDGLPPRKDLGTVGLWCALHGEAILQAGMHHLECQFDFDALRRQMEGEFGVRVMKPFTNFPYLRQAFTEGEVWPVRPERIEKLLAGRADHRGAGEAVPREGGAGFSPGEPRAQPGIQGLQPDRHQRDHRPHGPPEAARAVGLRGEIPNLKSQISDFRSHAQTTAAARPPSRRRRLVPLTD